MPTEPPHSSTTHGGYLPRAITLAPALCAIGGQLGTLRLFHEFARPPQADAYGNSGVIWVAYVLCIVCFVALSVGMLREAVQAAKPHRPSFHALLIPMAVYVMAWSVLTAQALRIDTAVMLDDIGWAFLFCLTLTSLLPLPGNLGTLAASQHALQCGALIWLYLIADNGHSAVSLQMTLLLSLLCAANHLAVKRANERLALDQRLKEQGAQVTYLHEAHVSKSRLLAMVSHDLRQPVHALGLMLERIQQTAPEFSDRVEVGAVNDVTSSLTYSLNMLMAVTRLNSGDIVALPESVPLAQLFSALNHEFKGSADQNALRLEFDHGHLHVATDPNLLRIILSNLIANSIKYSRKGRIAVRASLKDEESIRIDVSDQGIGIAAHDLPRIFDPFVKLQLRSTEQDGVGLGLAIVKQVADLIQAPLNISSEIGVGTTFSIELPRTEVPPQAENTSPEMRFHDLLVVVVDNDKVVLDNTVQTLEAWGCRVIAARNWAELTAGLARKAGPIDLILSDFHLDGGVSGYDVIIKLRKRERTEIPGILLTGDVELRHAAEGRSQNVVVAYKPLPSKQLAMLVHETTAATVARELDAGHHVPPKRLSATP